MVKYQKYFIGYWEKIFRCPLKWAGTRKNLNLFIGGNDSGGKRDKGRRVMTTGYTFNSMAS